ncbi:MAG: 6-carboxytetrahydropterin synthase [Roseiflexaceae bacterium]|nr:6-carboxytetrahydropterin synthase [Roseiflexaceae bacterium]
MAHYKIHISKDNLMFAAGHFASYDGSKVEPAHGHNYRFSVTVEGPLDQNSYVFNFVTLKRMMKRISDELDHRMLLPSESVLISVEPQPDGGVLVRVGTRWYRFPGEDVVILPIANTTVELIARYLCGQLHEQLAQSGDASHLCAIEVEVEETFGQSATYREELEPSA